MHDAFERLHLPGGLELAYARHGAGAKKAIFFHGHPGSRHQAAFLEPHLAAAGVALLAFDRPGYGNSSPFASSGGEIDLSAEVAALAGAAGFEKFHLVAVSGGAPYALRAAAELGDRVLSATIVCGLGPLHDQECRPHFPKSLLAVMHLARSTPNPILETMVRMQLSRLTSARPAGAPEGAGLRPPFMSEGDFALLGSGEARARIGQGLEAAFRQGVQGSKRDLRAYLAPWELRWERIRCPVVFHHGLDDRLVPWQFSEILASRIAGARFVPYEGEGHYTLPIGRAGEILRGLGG